MSRNIHDKFNDFKESIKKKKEEHEKFAAQKELEYYNEMQKRYDDILKSESIKQKHLSKMDKIKTTTYTKKIVAIILFFSIACITASYVLAYMDKSNTLENLSIQLCITILGVAFVYMVRAYFDSKAEHKNADVKFRQEMDGIIKNKVQDIIDNAGLNVDVDEVLYRARENQMKQEYSDEQDEDEETNPHTGLIINNHDNMGEG